MPKFYLFGVCYMCVRMYTNLFGTLLPFYLTDVLVMGDNSGDQVSYNIALVPVLAYAASVGVSTQLNKFYQIFGRKKALFVGTAICLVCLGVMSFLKSSASWVMYILAFFIGTFYYIQGHHNLWSYQLASTWFLTWLARRVNQEPLCLEYTVYWINLHAG